MRRCGSITIFMVMSLTMVMSLFFSMSEVVRYFCMKSTAHTLAASAAQSGLGDYNRLLYEEYGILAVDMGYGGAAADEQKLVSRMTSYASEGGDPSHDRGIIKYVNLCRMYPTDTKLDKVTLLTDYKGAGFMKEAAAQAKYDIPMELIEKWEDAGRAAQGVTAAGYVPDRTLLSASVIDAVEHRVYVTGSRGGRVSGEDESLEIVDAVESFRKRGVLYQVLGSDMGVSGGRITSMDRVSKRSLNRGDAEEKNLTVSDKLLYKLWLLDRLGCYTDRRERANMNYELEYVVSGNLTDEENLRSVVKKLLALREAENLVALSSDGARRSEAEGLAAAASAALMNPELEPVITMAILSSWAYVESVLDVRLLLSGGRVPLIKEPSNWTSNLATLPEYLNTDVKAIDVSSGIDYKGYLFAFMCVTPSARLGLRPLDLMEEELHQNEDYVNVRMDNMMIEGTYHVKMSGSPLFLSMAPLVSTKLSVYEYTEEPILSYL
ncbi:MAG: DUF5702 domain-containing protein [Lachnospiraceae bacterium]|nr:DUF5702 domain-containing protein [Lachnospiraceae bacterium]